MNLHRKSTAFKVWFAFSTYTVTYHNKTKPVSPVMSVRLLALSVCIFCYFSSLCLIYLCDGSQCCDRWLSVLEMLPLFALFTCPCNLKCIHSLAILLFTSSAIYPEPPKLGLPLLTILSLAQQVKLEGYFQQCVNVKELMNIIPNLWCILRSSNLQNSAEGCFFTAQAEFYLQL